MRAKIKRALVEEEIGKKRRMVGHRGRNEWRKQKKLSKKFKNIKTVKSRRGATYTGRTSQKESVYLKVKNYFWSFFTPFWMTTPL